MNEQLKQIGSRIREERKQKGYNLQEFATQVNLSPAYLSQIENGRVNINILILESISKALSVPLVNFFVDSKTPEISVLPNDERRWLPLGSQQAAESLLVKTKSNLEIFIIRLPPGEDSDEDSSHPGEEVSYVVQGSVTMIMNTSSQYLLKKDDAMYYNSAIPHRWKNTGDQEALVIVINTPATF